MSEQDELSALREQVEKLTARVYHLEQRIGTASTISSPAPPSAPGIARSTPVSARPAGKLPPAPTVSQPESLERRIGSHWLNRVGVVAMLVGVSYFLKLAFDNGWIGPGLRVLIGCTAGVGLGWWSERFRRPNSLAFSYSLKAVAAGVLYLSLWASFQLYHILPGAIAFLAMALVTAAVAGLALAQDAELLAGLALLGGLLTPVLCATNENHEAALFFYLALLSLGAFVLQRIKPWPRILLGAFGGTFLLVAEWFGSYYGKDQFAETLLFFSLLFAIFAVAPLYGILEPERDHPTRLTGLLLAILNAFAYFAAIYSQLESSGGSVRSHAAAYALGLAAVYAALGVALDRRIEEHPGIERLLPMAHYGLAVTFVTIAIPLKLHEHWITLAWLIEGGLVFWAGASTSHRRVKLFARVVALLGILRLLRVDLNDWGTQSPIFNPRLASFAVAIGVLLWMVYLDSKSPHAGVDRAAMAAAVIVVNVLALLAAGLEIHDTFAPLLRAAVLSPDYPTFDDVRRATHALAILRSFSYSALFMLYGAGLMWTGFAWRLALLRWQAILLIAATVIKVFFFDVSGLDRGWRVLSFIILGALLLAISYAYQRDWLRLQRPRSG